MRYIFMDEAGTSAHEPVSIVVGLIANADEHVIRAEELANEALGGVPDQFKDQFTFHATEVFGSKRLQAGWSMTDRLNLLKQMMSIPRRIGMAICVSAHWRGAVDFSDSYGKLGLSADQCDHLNAFVFCISVADRNIRNHGGPSEVATIVAEDHKTMRKYLKVMPSTLRKSAMLLPASKLRLTSKDKEAGYLTQSGDIRITRVRDAVHFVEKGDDPLVQVADACAYGFRRYFAKEKFGLDFAKAILGDETRLRHFGAPGGAECYWPI